MAREIMLNGDMENLQYRDGVLSSSGSFQGELGVFLKEGLPDGYTGETTVIPRARNDIVLPTKDTVVLEDITVKQVPYYATSNEAGGNTIYIAKE